MKKNIFKEICVIENSLDYPNRNKRLEIKTVKKLIEMCNVRFPAVRSDAIDLLSKSYWRYGCVLDVLRKKLTSDPAWLVRVSAAEAIGAKKYKEASPELVKAIEDENPVVRRYAGYALADIKYLKTKQVIERRLKMERSSYAKLHMYEVLYDLGEISILFKILSMLKSRKSIVRYNTAAILLDIADKDNLENILNKIRKALKVESKAYLKKIFKKYIKKLCKKFSQKRK